jgi:hypothetical protein
MYTMQEKTRPTRHMLSTLGPRMTLNHTYLTWSMYSSLSWGQQQGWTDALLLKKSASDSTPQPGWVVYGAHLNFSPNTIIEVVHLSQAPVVGRLLGLLGSYHQHTISTNLSVLNRHRQGLPYRNLGIATTLSPPFPSKCSTGPPKWPRPVFILSNSYKIFQSSSLGNLWPPRGLPTTRPSIVAYIYA